MAITAEGGSGMSILQVTLRRAGQGALVGLLASLALLATPRRAVGDDVRDVQQARGAEAKPSERSTPRKVSPYAKVARERAQAPKSEHRPNLRLSVRGAQKSGR